MDVTNILSNPSSATAATAQDRYQATKDQFLNLLMAQLKNQDPMDAPDVNKLSEQITSFGQLEQLMNLNKSMEGMSQFQSSQEKSQAVSLIGKTVQVNEQDISIDGDNKGKINFRLDDDADEVNVSITDTLGRVVRNVKFNNVAAGESSNDFDGLAEDGSPLPNGNYRIQVDARKQNGQKVAASSMVQGVVSDVVFASGGTIITINNKPYRMDQVMSVKQTVL